MSTKSVFRFTSLLLVVVLALSPLAVLARPVAELDEQAGSLASSEDNGASALQDPKMHWPQDPDISPEGLDVAMFNAPLADDFQCTESGPIEHITIWTSFNDDALPAEGLDSLTFQLAIHANIPAGVVQEWSMPGDQLWSQTFFPGDYVVSEVPSTAPEGWYDPVQGYWEPFNHSRVFQYDFLVVADPFWQTVDEIYWLAAQADYPLIGWKTTMLDLRFEDDATVLLGEWMELRYPIGHPYETESIDLSFVIFGGGPMELEYGDAPEGPNVTAYPATGVTGSFPTCWSAGPAGFVEHNNFGAWFGPAFDFELDGNAGWCPPPGCFPPYDQDECFADGDAGLLFPEPFTIDAAINVVPCPGFVGGPLGAVCQFAAWGVDIDIDVTNLMPSGVDGFVNVLMDWDQNGAWGGSSPCPTAAAPEHVLVDFVVPNGFTGPLSALMPPGFLIGPNPGHVWARFSITEAPVGLDWNGEGSFEDGESEDYLLLVVPGYEELDFGDAMDPTYPTVLANDGARHIIDGVTFLGAQVDPEPDGQPDPAAIGDDQDLVFPPPNDDEDGVLFTSAMVRGQPATVDVIASVPGLLNAWFDFNIDGDWDEADEHIFIDEPLVAGANLLTFGVPATATIGETFVRFRFSTQAGLWYDGLAHDGEVEDYKAYIQEPKEHFKMHWPQYPDMSFTGLDVEMVRAPGGALGDDFLCRQSGPINHIRIWTSFADDILPALGPDSLTFQVSIHANIPADPPLWSRPGEVLWERVFGPGQYKVRRLTGHVPEGWYDPLTQWWMPDNHFQAYQYDFFIEQDAFFQQADQIYWLVVSEILTTSPNYTLGWKTTPIELHFEDDATYLTAGAGWLPLEYPGGHPYADHTLDLAFAIYQQPREYGDAPEGSTAIPVIAYPSTGVFGWFPSCWSIGPAGWVQHNNFGAWFGPAFDFETDGNAGLCPPPGCFPPYDVDECYKDGDAGLIVPEPFTIDAFNTVVPCPTSAGTPLGIVCQPALWGTDIDIHVHNTMPNDTVGFVNVLVDWDQNGAWGGNSFCPWLPAPILVPEHVLVDFPIPPGYDGPLSALMPLGSFFRIGPNPGFVWVRFTISEQQVGPDWNGAGAFEDGESEDYLLWVLRDLDFGDAIDLNYRTLLASDGARHLIDGVTFLGGQVDPEPDGQPDPAALGDDQDLVFPPPNDDEDGVLFTSAILPGQPATVDVVASVPGILNAWFDFNIDGDWDEPGEQIFANEPLGAGSNILTFNVPAAAVIGETFVRFRFSTQRDLNYYGPADDGEVEDYKAYIQEPKEHFKMHWPQYPDMSYTGMDVDMFDAPLGDDFLCTQSGPITHVRMWASFADDILPVNGPGSLTLQVSFHANVPPGVVEPWSMPGDMLWTKTFVPGEYKVEQLTDHVPEGWYDPVTEEWMPDNHFLAFQYDFFIDDDPFLQHADTVYWLVMTEILPAPPDYTIGWKTTTVDLRWEDDATHWLPDIGWLPMVYPEGHPYWRETLDLAFVIQGPPPVDLDFGDAIDPTYPTVLASDGARHIIDGVTFLGAQVDPEPDGQPDLAALGDDQDLFFPPANDDEDGVFFTSAIVPGQPATVAVIASVPGLLNAWFDFNIDGDWDEANEHIFIDEPLVAGVNNLMFNVAGAVAIGETFVRFRFSTQPGLWYDGLADDGEVEDYKAYIQEPKDHFKMHWPQYPDMSHTGLDVDMFWADLADDFRCTQSGPINHIRMWGSFADDILPMDGPESLTFQVSIHANIPAGDVPWSMPGDMLWTRLFEPGQYKAHRVTAHVPEGWYDPLTNWWMPDNHLRAYQYDFFIEHDPFFQQADEIYWLVVKHIHATEPGYTFGWKTTPLKLQFEDDATFRADGAGWQRLVYPSWHPYESITLDLAFAIYQQPREYGDAPEGPSSMPVIAYPGIGLAGRFPTCWSTGPAGWVQHNNFGAWFGPTVDLESDGNQGLCPPPGCFPPYDVDECFQDGDAGLIVPEPFTIDPLINVVPCPASAGTPLGIECLPAVWGVDIDIDVHNHMPGDTRGFVNLLVDWNRDGTWGGASSCAGVGVPEHVLVDLPVPNGYDGPLSALMPAGSSFLIGPKHGFVWARFSITERPVGAGWNGEGGFEDGESEDYLLQVLPEVDFGDAMDPTYPTLLANDGARHIIDGIAFLGATVDREPDGQPDPAAIGDDQDIAFPPANDDEDGVLFTSAILPGQPATVDIAASVAGLLSAWFDFNIDGDWDEPDEHIFIDEPLAAGGNSLSFNVPAGAVIGETFVRFRFSTQPGLWYDGRADDGEVEDYKAYIQEPKEHFKMHWPQYPDMSHTGIDVSMFSAPLADDFLCTESGPITHIRLWGSFADDILPADGPGSLTLKLGFHANIPAGVVEKWSMPGDVLWERVFFPGEYEVTRIADHMPEWWCDPVTAFCDPINHFMAFQYDFFIEHDPFFQEADWIYWLSVTDLPPAAPDYTFGWKTTPPELHFEDDATIWLPDRGWLPLVYPPFHPYGGITVDLAFVIQGPPAVDLDFGDAIDANYRTLLASDGARHIIDGVTFLGAQVDPEPDGQPDPAALGDDYDLVFPPANDDEDGVFFISAILPGQPATVGVIASVAGLLNAWFDFNIDGDWDEAGEHIFIDEPLVMGGTALTFNVPAAALIGETFARFRFSTQAGLWYDGLADDGEVEDYRAYIQEPKEHFKMHWPQYPDMSHTGLDVSLYSTPLADDFLCTESGPITHIRMWGSFDGDVLPTEGGPGSLTFRVAIHENIPAGAVEPWSMPGPVLWDRTFGPGQYEVKQLTEHVPEGFYDPVIESWEPDSHFKAFQYDFYIEDDPFFQHADTVYWLAVTEVEPSPDYVFGWKTTPADLRWEDDATYWETDTGWLPMVYPEGHTYVRETLDLAFVIQGPPVVELEHGDAPEGTTAIAYPATGVTGSFPTCKTIGPAGWVEHSNFGAWFGPTFDLELDGNAGLCPACFPPYDRDECFQDGDAGLMVPEAFTIDPTINVVPCPGVAGTPLGLTCQQAVWGTDIDIDVHNHMPGDTDGYVNLLVDWNQDGQWAGASPCPGVMVREHVLVDFPIPNPYDGPLSALMPAGSSFQIGPNPGFVWVRFSITEVPVGTDWHGEGSFEDGETEDYLLEIIAPPPPEIEVIKTLVEPVKGVTRISKTITYTIGISNTGPTAITHLPLYDYYCPACLEFTSWSMDPTSVDSTLGVVHWANVLDPVMGGPGILLPGHSTVITVDFHAQIIDTMYWKEAGWMDYAPKGMPDFDQKQDGWYDPAGNWYYCGPTAVANSLWWFDSKFEPNPIPPPAINDGYPLVQSYNMGGWDDHDPLNVQRFVTALAVQMGTAPGAGTSIVGLTNGILNYINGKGLGAQYTVHREPNPAFGWIEDEVRRSEDVILLLGFWQEVPPGSGNYERVGGHYVTVAGIDSLNTLIAFSDPFLDKAETGWWGRVLPNPHGGLHPSPGPISDTVHNDAKYASHDVYGVVPTESPGGHWGPEGYAATCDEIWNFQGQNEGDHPNALDCVSGWPIYTEVEYAVAVSPITPTMICHPTDNFAVASGAIDESGHEVPEAQGHASVIVNRKPAVGTVTPASGSGPTGVTTYFTTTWMDPDGWMDLKQCYFHIADSSSIVGSVTLLYNALKNKLWLRTDDGTGWIGGFAPGSANIIENSQGKVHCALTTVQASGDTVEVKWALEFKAGYEGAKKTGLKCKDRHKARGKGKWKGTWTIF